MTSRLSGYQCHTSFDEPCSSCNTVTVTLAIGQDLIIINKKVDYDEIFASYLGEIDIFRVLFFIRLICDSWHAWFIPISVCLWGRVRSCISTQPYLRDTPASIIYLLLSILCMYDKILWDILCWASFRWLGCFLSLFPPTGTDGIERRHSLYKLRLT